MSTDVEKVYRDIDTAVRRIEVARAKFVLHKYEKEALTPQYFERIDLDLEAALKALADAQRDRIPF